tara:strand:- start:2081 stop:2665 length:585 start_codon:yes stop_codon:yes gene_type:complete
MSNILFSDENDRVQNVNIDELFEKNQQKDLKQLSIFNKILNRIHKRIQHTGKNKREKFIFYQVPEYLFGEPLYKQGDCIGFLVVKLEENGFEVQYMHPNTLFITWKNHVPSYVRNEIKKKTGVVVDEKGNILNQEELDEQKEQDPTSKLLNDRNQPVDNNKNKKEYTPIDEYTPSGNFVYKDDMLKKIEKKMNS